MVDFSKQIAFLRKTLHQQSAKLYLETAECLRNMQSLEKQQEVRQWAREEFQQSLHLQNIVSIIHANLN